MGDTASAKLAVGRNWPDGERESMSGDGERRDEKGLGHLGSCRSSAALEAMATFYPKCKGSRWTLRAGDWLLGPQRKKQWILLAMQLPTEPALAPGTW